MGTLSSFPNGLKIAGYIPPTDATITVGSEVTNVVNVAIQLTDGNGDDLANVAAVYFYISDDSGGSGVAATAPAGGIAIGTDGTLAEVVSGKAGWLISEADGDIDIDVTETGTDTFYLVLIMPSGETVVSGAITFAA